MKTRAFSVMLGLFLAATGLSGCGDPVMPPINTPVPPATPTNPPPPPSPTIAPSPTVAQVQIEEGWEDYDRTQDGFKIALPPDWEQFDLDPATLRASIEELKVSNPQLAQVLDSQATTMATSGVKFYAFDQSADVSSTGYLTSLNVIATSLPGSISLDLFVQSIVSQLPARMGSMLVGDITHERVKLGATEAEKVNYILSIATAGSSEPTRAATTQYVMLEDDQAYIVTFSALEGDLDRYADTFARIAQTFRPLP